MTSTGYDGTVRLLDFETKKCEILAGDEGVYLNYHKEIDSNTLAVAMGVSGLLGVIDKRLPGSNKIANTYQVF